LRGDARYSVDAYTVGTPALNGTFLEPSYANDER
jgi:hypothetical protein